MEFVPLLVILATVKKIVDLARYVKAGDANGIVTQLLAWVAGSAVIALAAHTPWAAGLEFGGVALATLNIPAQIFVGIAVGSAGSLATDALKAADNSQSAALPPLVGPPSPSPHTRT